MFLGDANLDNSESTDKYNCSKILRSSRDLKVDGCQSNLYVM